MDKLEDKKGKQIKNRTKKWRIQLLNEKEWQRKEIRQRKTGGINYQNILRQRTPSNITKGCRWGDRRNCERWGWVLLPRWQRVQGPQRPKWLHSPETTSSCRRRTSSSHKNTEPPLHIITLYTSFTIKQTSTTKKENQKHFNRISILQNIFGMLVVH